MAENKVKYYVRIDDKFVNVDAQNAENKVTSAFGKIGKTIKAAAVAIGAALVSAGTSAVVFGSQFETSMAKSSTLINTSTTDMNMLGDKVLELSDRTGIAADALGNTMYNALSAGVKMGEDGADMMSFLEKNAKLAKSGFTDVDTAVTTTAKVMNAYKMSVEDTDKIHKILMQTQNNGITTVGELGASLAQVTPTAAAMSVGFDQVGAALATMTAQGTPTAQATTQLNSLFAELGKQGTNAQKALEEAAVGTKYAGMSFQDMMEAGVPLNEVLGMMEKEADKSGKSLLDMFGSLEAGKAALAMSGANAQQYTNNLISMSTEADVVGEAFEKVSNTSAERFKLMLNQLKNSSIDLYNEMLPLITMALPILQIVLDGVISAVKTSVGWLKELAVWMQENETYVALIAIAITTLTAAIIAFNISLHAKAIAAVIATTATTAYATAIAFLTSPITLVVAAIGALITITWLLVENWEEVSAWIVSAWEWVKEKAVEIFEALREFFVATFEAIKEFIISTWKGISDFLTELWNAIKECAIEVFSQLSQFLTELWNAIKNTIISVCTFIGDFIQESWNRIIATITLGVELLKSIFEAGFTFIGATIENATSTWVKVFKNLLDFIKNIFTGNWRAAWENVKNIFSSIADGIGSAFKAPINYIIDLINGFISGLNNIKIPDWVPGIGGKGFVIPNIPRLKTGIDFVPSDYFPAYLDYGERVLTKEENAAFSALGGLPGIEYAFTSQEPTKSNETKIYNFENRVDVTVEGSANPITVGREVVDEIDRRLGDIIKYVT